MEMALLSLRHADGHLVDDGGGVVHKHLHASVVDGFPCSPAISEYLAQSLLSEVISWKTLANELEITD